jgi:hypothetical protein
MWTQERNGQVIACGNSNDTWLPFIPIGNLSGVSGNTTEAMWITQ